MSVYLDAMNAEPAENVHRLKIGWLTGEAYCERCGRAQAWPCPLAEDAEAEEDGAS